MSLLQSELSTTHDAHAGEVSQLSADRDALAEQGAEQRAQCEAQSAELEALRQQLTDAMEGEKLSSTHCLIRSSGGGLGCLPAERARRESTASSRMP